MVSSGHHFPQRLHPKLRHLEHQFRDLLLRPFDPDTLARLMKMEVETAFPGLNERDQEQIVDIVLEHMQFDKSRAAKSAAAHPTNIIQFPVIGRAVNQ